MNTYTELVNAVTAFLGQEGNIEVTDQVPLFISLGEADVYRSIRHDRMVKSVAVGTVPPYLIPDDCIEPSAVMHGYETCEFVPANVVLSQDAGDAAPTQWSIFGGELIFDGTPTDVTVLSYFSKPAELVQETNPIFTQNPDLFLYAALAHAMIFMRDEARQSVWSALFQKKVQEVDSASWHSRLPKQQPLRLRTI